MTDILRARLLSAFTCLGDRCEDTCCQGWSMQMDEPTLAKYRAEAPLLLAAVEPDADGAPIMRKDKSSGFCVRLENGLCGIHKEYGNAFLGDACHFYPRVTRQLGEQGIMTAAMSCPEIVRLAMAEDEPCAMEVANVERLPHTMKDYLPEDLILDEALAVHRAFLTAADNKEVAAERLLLRMMSAVHSLARIEKKSWPVMAEFYIKNADMRLPPPETNPADPFNSLHALCGLVVASKKPPSPRLLQTMTDMEIALNAKLDWQQVQIVADEESLAAYEKMRERWHSAAPRYAPLLRRWLQMQLSLALFPFAGFGAAASERIAVIGVRLATVKLALMSAHFLHQEALDAVRIVQSLSRFLDHLGDPGFSLQIYRETGWIQEARMRGLLEG